MQITNIIVWEGTRYCISYERGRYVGYVQRVESVLYPPLTQDGEPYMEDTAQWHLTPRNAIMAALEIWRTNEIDVALRDYLVKVFGEPWQDQSNKKT